MAGALEFESCKLEGKIPEEILIARITEIHNRVSNLESLRPSKQLNSLLSELVKLCILPSSIDMSSLSPEAQQMRESLLNLSGKAEALLELEFANLLVKIPQPLNKLNLFPYYGNYVKLAQIEATILSENGVFQPKQVAFVGSGPMPLTSLVLATHHFKSTEFHNYDVDEDANEVAGQIVGSDEEVEKRMKFVTKDIMEVKEKLSEYDCIILAALVGMRREEKVKIIKHIRKYMKEGGILVVRSANGARAFLYPVVDTEVDLAGFQLLSIFHPANDVINSVILLRKPFF